MKKYVSEFMNQCTKPANGDPDNAALCFGCHNFNNLLGSGFSKTNFNDAVQNHHFYHFNITGTNLDSDFDGTLDSAITCIGCHNVHGAPNSAMIRHGELISTPGTTDKVPALNFTYSLIAGGTDPYADVEDTKGGDMLYAGSFAANKVCNDCHDSEYYERAAFVGPEVLTAEASPSAILPSVLTAVTFTARVVDSSTPSNIDTVRINLASVGGLADQLMYDNGTNGDAVAGDGVYSFQKTDVNVTAGLYCLTVTATDLTALTGQNDLELRVQAANAVILDHRDATYVGAWILGSAGDSYGCDVKYNLAGTGADTATWRPDLAQAGNYRVWGWWSVGANRATNAKYTITYNGGSTIVEVNQQQNGGQWNELGIYQFAAGTSGSVQLNDDANGIVIADAVWFELVSAYTISGQITEGTAGLDGVTVALTGDSTRSTVTAGGGLYSFLVVNGSYTVTPTSTQYVYGPGSRGVTVSGANVSGRDFTAYDPVEIIIDNADPEATYVGTWDVYPSSGNAYGPDYRYNAAGSGADTATWTPAIPQAGTYDVYAQWSANAFRSDVAPYTINYSGGSDLVPANQKINGAQWNLLGTYSLAPGTGSVVLTDNVPTYGVVADAIRWVLVSVP